MEQSFPYFEISSKKISSWQFTLSSWTWFSPLNFKYYKIYSDITMLKEWRFHAIKRTCLAPIFGQKKDFYYRWQLIFWPILSHVGLGWGKKGQKIDFFGWKSWSRQALNVMSGQVYYGQHHRSNWRMWADE